MSHHKWNTEGFIVDGYSALSKFKLKVGARRADVGCGGQGLSK